MLNLAEPSVKNRVTAILKAIKVTNRTDCEVGHIRPGGNKV